jgi:hypothetical protein
MTPAEFTKVPGSLTNVSAEAMNFSPMATLIKENSPGAKLTAKEPTSGGMEKSMTASGTRDRRKAMESGRASMGTPILDSGKIARLKAMGYMSGLMETGMRESGISALDMGMELTFLLMGIITPGSMSMESHVDSASTNGQMEILTRVNSNLDKNMEKVNGRKDHQMRLIRIDSINMMDITKWTRSMALVLLYGSQGMCIKVTIITMSVKAMEQCSGQIKVSSRATGSRESNKVSVS